MGVEADGPPRWAWRTTGGMITLGLLTFGEPVSAVGAVVAFAAAEIVFDAAAAQSSDSA